MDLKKSNQANLEHKRISNFIIGLIVTFSLILISFEWTSPLDRNYELALANNIEIDIEVMEAIPREEPKPLPKEELPAIKTVIDIVPDDVELEDVDFSTEVTKNTVYIFSFDDTEEPEIIDEAPIPFAEVADKPLFNGGNPNVEFARYVARHLKYPEIAAENGVYGRVTLQFVIDENGKLVDPVILRGVDPALDAEALRVVLASPKWTPGKQRNKPVKVSYTFPINFRLR
ncbi:MAG: TonB family protein [Bacteroidota bacterium]|nr:TonB family protein [Bacteroidota bacterium]